VSDLLVRRMAPLVLMPFARFGSRSIARTWRAWGGVGFSRSGGFNRLCASAPVRPFQRRAARWPCAVSLKRFAARDSGRRVRSSRAH